MITFQPPSNRLPTASNRRFAGLSTPAVTLPPYPPLGWKVQPGGWKNAGWNLQPRKKGMTANGTQQGR